MRFSVDAHTIGCHLTGNEVYIRNLLNEFARLDQQAEFVAYYAKREAPASARLSALAYGAGVLLSFAGLAAALIGLREGGAAIGWGFQLQSPLVVTVLGAGLGMNVLQGRTDPSRTIGPSRRHHADDPLHPILSFRVVRTRSG